MTTNIFDMVDTWNNGATVFTAIKMNVTDTASDAASLLMDLQVGSTSKFKIRKDGVITLVGVDVNNDGGAYNSYPDFRIGSSFSPPGIIFGVNSIIAWTPNDYLGTKDTGISRIGAADLALGNGALGDATGNLRIGSLRINQTPTANTSATTTITNGADSATNLGHRASFSMNGTTYWFPCGATAF